MFLYNRLSIKVGMSELSSTACLELPECNKLLSSGIPLPKNVVSIFVDYTLMILRLLEGGDVYGELQNSEL